MLPQDSKTFWIEKRREEFDFVLGEGEVISVLDSYLREFNDKDGSFIVELYRCSKSVSFKKTKVYIPPVGLFNSAVHMRQHLERIPKNQSEENRGRIWWRWNSQKEVFARQVMGKSQVSTLAKKITKFLGKDTDGKSAHSFRRSALVEAGGSEAQLKVSGGVGLLGELLKDISMTHHEQQNNGLEGLHLRFQFSSLFFLLSLFS